MILDKLMINLLGLSNSYSNVYTHYDIVLTNSLQESLSFSEQNIPHFKIGGYSNLN